MKGEVRVEVYEPKKAPEKPSSIVRLALKLCTIGGRSISLVAVDEDGKTLGRGTLLHICADGVYLSRFVNEALGFPLGTGGRLKVLEEFPDEA